MKQMLLPDNEADAPAWYRRAFRRCAVARANTAWARWLQPASAYLKLDAARRSPSPSVSSNYAVPSSESSDDEIWRKYAGERETSSEDYQIFGMLAFLTSKHEFQRIKYSESVRFQK